MFMSLLMENLRHLVYDQKYKWLECGMCHEMTSPASYVVGSRACISCTLREAEEYEKHKEMFDTMHQNDNYEPSV